MDGESRGNGYIEGRNALSGNMLGAMSSDGGVRRARADDAQELLRYIREMDELIRLAEEDTVDFESFKEKVDEFHRAHTTRLLREFSRLVKFSIVNLKAYSVYKDSDDGVGRSHEEGVVSGRAKLPGKGMWLEIHRKFG